MLSGRAGMLLSSRIAAHAQIIVFRVSKQPCSSIHGRTHATHVAFQVQNVSCNKRFPIQVWDLAVQTCQHTLKHHTDKVQVVCWNPAEAPILLSGGFDARACILDLRDPKQAGASWKLSKDVEALTWNPHTPTQFLAACEDGLVTCFDARSGSGSKPLFTLSAHDKPTTSICYNPSIPGLLATASTDKTVRACLC